MTNEAASNALMAVVTGGAGLVARRLSKRLRASWRHEYRREESVQLVVRERLSWR
ncbi:MAG: hypothetical protein JRN12_07715 [Nitrososphaerota archaeon]|nr:hypothetical protein [Nitrososphaerota archaeon]